VPRQERATPDGAEDPPTKELDPHAASHHPSSVSQVNHDRLTVELIEPDSTPPMVRIVWPAAPTVVDPKRFPDVAAAIAQLLRGQHRARCNPGGAATLTARADNEASPGLAPPPPVGPPL
jgi:hypothetical protein